MAQEIQRQLEEVEVKQRELERLGVSVEKALRGEGTGKAFIFSFCAYSCCGEKPRGKCPKKCYLIHEQPFGKISVKRFFHLGKTLESPFGQRAKALSD